MLARMKHLQSLVRAVVAPQDFQFIRLSPNRRGRLYFYSKTSRSFFSVRSRGIADSSVADQVFTDQEYRLPFEGSLLDRQLAEIFAAGKRPLIIDCGAHIGLASRYFAELYPGAKVVGIEPAPENALLARQHCADLTNVEIVQAAIGSRSGFARIRNSEADGWALQVERADTATEIEVIKIADVIAANPDCSLAIVKIDIEGFESDLFESNLEWIDACPLIIIELHDWLMPGAGTSANFLKAIAGRSRDFMQRGENVFSLRN